MYLIANSSRNEITLSDLGITLGPNQAIDLHKVKTLVSPERSDNLRLAERKGKVKVIHREESVSKKSQVDNPNNFEKEEILNELKNFMKDELKEQLSGLKKQDNNNSDSDIMGQVSQILNILKNSNTSGDSNNTEQPVAIEESDDIDIEKIATMHAKAVSKMSKNTEGSVDYEKSEVSDDSILDNASELENLM
jgi:hypothetical protein